jgi:hypothetical protein
MTMARNTKTKKQLIILCCLIGAILIILLYVYLNNGTVDIASTFTEPMVDKSFSQSVFDNPEYPKLQKSAVALPLDPGPKGRDNPYESFSNDAAPKNNAGTP